MMDLLGPGELDRIGPYRVVRQIGRGGMGRVLQVIHEQTGAAYALKLIHRHAVSAQSIARFRREAETLARTSGHPGIVRVHTAGEHAGHAYYVMEHIEGEALAARLARDGPLAIEAAAELVAQLADAVEHLHAHGVLHRDLKPQNVILQTDGRARLVDFGLALDAEGHRLTQEGELLGTPMYIAPEQISDAGASDSGAARTGPATDVYGLGMVLYETLCARPPFAVRGAVSLFKAVMHDPPTAPRAHRPEIPKPLEAICLKAIAKDPADRYPTAAALADDLRRFIRKRTVAARPGGALEAMLRPTRRRRRALAALGAIALVAVAATALAVTLRGGRARAPTAPLLVELDEAWRSLTAPGTAARERLRALREGEDVLERLDAIAAGSERVTADRRVVIETLAALTRGDPAALERVDLGAMPFRPYRDAVLDVLAASARTADLARLTVREPDLLEHPALAGRALMTSVLLRRAELALGAPRPDPAALDATLVRLLPLLHLPEAPLPTFSPAALDRLVTLALDDGGGDLPAVRRLEAAATLLPVADERAGPVLARLYARVVGGREVGRPGLARPPAADDPALAAAIAVQRFCVWPFPFDSIASYVGEDVEELAQATLESPHGLDASRAGTLLAVLWADERVRITDLDGGGPRTRLRAFAIHWPLVRALLVREHEHGDVPPGIVTWLVRALLEAGVAGPDSEDAADVRGRIAAAIGIEVPTDQRGAAQALGALIEAAIAHDARRPVQRRSVHALEDQARVLRDWDQVAALRVALDAARLQLDRRLAPGLPPRELGDPLDGAGGLDVAVAKLLLDCVRLLHTRSDHDPALEECRYCEPIGEAARLSGELLDPLEPRRWPTSRGEIEALRLWRHGQLDAGLAAFDAALAAGAPFNQRTLLDTAELLLGLGAPEHAGALLRRTLRGPVLGRGELVSRAAMWRQLGEPALAERDIEAARK